MSWFIGINEVNHGTQLRHPLGFVAPPCQEAAPLLGVRADGSGLAHGTGGAVPGRFFDSWGPGGPGAFAGFVIPIWMLWMIWMRLKMGYAVLVIWC